MSDTLLATPAPSVLRDVIVLSWRGVRLSTRNVEALIMALALPVVLMLVFVFLLGGAIDTGGDRPYVQFALPGVLLICIGFGAGTTAVAVATDLATATIDRYRAMDARPAALVGGHVAATVLRSIASTLIVVAMAFALGYRSAAGALAWAAAAGVLLAYLIGLSWLCAMLGVVASSAETASGFTFLVSFLPYLSSAVVPIETMPGWLQPVARHQPLTPVIESLRGLLDGRHAATSTPAALAWCGAIVLVSVTLATVAYRRRFGR
jgi:ABC-2 type transport system permease protein